MCSENMAKIAQNVVMPPKFASNYAHKLAQKFKIAYFEQLKHSDQP